MRSQADSREDRRTVAVIQARMTSTRLPGKVLADFFGRPMLAHMLDRVRRARRLDAIWVATTANATDDPVADLCAASDVPVFRGDEHDVLSRFVAVAEEAGAEIVVRLTADCPLIDPTVVDAAVDLRDREDRDYLSNAIRRTYPDGLDVEVFTRAALETADRETKSGFMREHVTPYLRTGCYPDAGVFSVGHLCGPADFSHLRWTVDTAADLAHARRLAERVSPTAGWLEIVALLTRRPDLLTRGSTPYLALRPAATHDCDRLLDWANRPESLAGKLKTVDPIPRDTHEAWFAARLQSPDCRIWIAERDGRPVGQVRVERDAAGDAHVDVFVAPEGRGTGVAYAMLDEMVRAVAGIWPGVRLVARIRTDNAASRRLFAKAGYTAEATHADYVVLARVANPAPAGGTGEATA